MRPSSFASRRSQFQWVSCRQLLSCTQSTRGTGKNHRRSKIDHFLTALQKMARSYISSQSQLTNSIGVKKTQLMCFDFFLFLALVKSLVGTGFCEIEASPELNNARRISNFQPSMFYQTMNCCRGVGSATEPSAIESSTGQEETPLTPT